MRFFTPPALAASVFWSAQFVSAMPANPDPFEVQNSVDGSIIRVRMQGGPANHWLEDMDGFTICEQHENDENLQELGSSDDGEVKTGYYYCKRDGHGNLVPDKALVVGNSNPQAVGVPTGMQKPMQQQMMDCGEFCQTGSNGRRLHEIDDQHRRLQGSLKNLVVAFKFSNHATRRLPSRDDLDDLFNQSWKGGVAPTGSVKAVFDENSAGKLSLDSVVAPWVTISRTESECAGGSDGLVAVFHDCLREALNLVAASGSIDIRDFDQDNNSWIDAVTFLHSGYGAEWGGSQGRRIWSHKWGMAPSWRHSSGVQVSTYHVSPALWGTSGSAIGRIGVIAHETCHYLGLPDLYDTSFDGAGLGSWSLMANSWGFDGSQYYPPALDAWSKMKLGWITPRELNRSQRVTIKTAYTDNDYYIIRHGYDTNLEYLLVEYRRSIGFDKLVPQDGLIIYHVDENRVDASGQGYPGQSNWPANGNHYLVAILQADGRYDLEQNEDRGDAGDVYTRGKAIGPGPNNYPNTDGYRDGKIRRTGVSITNIGSAGGSSMQFDIVVPGAPTPPPPPPPTPSPTRAPVVPPVVDECAVLTRASEVNNPSAWRFRTSNGAISQNSDGAIRWGPGNKPKKSNNSGPEYKRLGFSTAEACMVAGTRWQIRAKLKLVRTGTDTGFDCDIRSRTTGVRCPAFRVLYKSSENNDERFINTARYIQSRWNPNGYNDFIQIVASPFDIRSFRFNFGLFPDGADLLVKDFSFTRVG